METNNATFDKSKYNPVLFKTYKIMKKLVKYSFYILLIYMTYEGLSWLLEN